MNRLRETRVIRRVTQFELSKLTDVYPSKISLIENGYVEPRPDEKLKLSRALGVKLEEVFPSD
jgi:transcriptional regulator with XRE-family HTH domain